MAQSRLMITGGSGFIGANLIAELDRNGEYEVLNLDVAQPKFKSLCGTHMCCDLLATDELMRLCSKFQPTHIVHLAARTDMFGVSLSDYAVNHIGTRNIVEAAKRTASVQKIIFTSSQYVVGPGPLPNDDEDYRPHTIYGASKVQSEREIRSAKLNLSWTIIRPTNIWGKWHPRYPYEFWRVVKRGLYVHPGGRPVTRCYGYVGNVVDQVTKILRSTDRTLDGATLYVGDAPIDIYEWTNAFSLELTGEPVRKVPRAILWGIGKAGDLFNMMGGQAPIFSSRVKSMTECYIAPMDKTYERLGPPKIPMREGVRETVDWLRSTSSIWR